MLRTRKHDNYNWIFDTKTGKFARWGQAAEDDPPMSPLGPEILDIEVSTICHGAGTPCAWCYKSNTPRGYNMSFNTFKYILDHMPPNLMQIAFGIGDIDANLDLFNMFAYTRSKNIIPNVTINGYRCKDTHFNALARLCGAVAVSHYDNDTCFNAIQELTSRGMDQVNIHKLLAIETLDSCHDLIEAATDDPRLRKLNAIVFLKLKPKGKRNLFHSIEDLKQYRCLFAHAKDAGVTFGMDSCSAPMLLKATENQKDISFDLSSVEPCESTLFSLYINALGQVFPCSFCEGEPGWEQGIDATKAQDFLKEIWFDERLSNWRAGLLASSSGCHGCAFKQGCRSCPQFDITSCKRCWGQEWT